MEKWIICLFFPPREANSGSRDQIHRRPLVVGNRTKHFNNCKII